MIINSVAYHLGNDRIFRRYPMFQEKIEQTIKTITNEMRIKNNYPNEKINTKRFFFLELREKTDKSNLISTARVITLGTVSSELDRRHRNDYTRYVFTSARCASTPSTHVN